MLPMQSLCGHIQYVVIRVRRVIDYADLSMTMRTPRVNYEGLPLTLKEQSGEINYLDGAGSNRSMFIIPKDYKY